MNGTSGRDYAMVASTDWGGEWWGIDAGRKVAGGSVAVDVYPVFVVDDATVATVRRHTANAVRRKPSTSGPLWIGEQLERALGAILEPPGRSN